MKKLIKKWLGIENYKVCLSTGHAANENYDLLIKECDWINKDRKKETELLAALAKLVNDLERIERIERRSIEQLNFIEGQLFVYIGQLCNLAQELESRGLIDINNLIRKPDAQEVNEKGS